MHQSSRRETFSGALIISSPFSTDREVVLHVRGVDALKVQARDVRPALVLGIGQCLRAVVAAALQPPHCLLYTSPSPRDRSLS
eukprot:782943-Pyramimonas_sp.AAC.2